VEHLFEIGFTELLKILPAGFLPVRIKHFWKISDVTTSSGLGCVSRPFRFFAFFIGSANFYFRRIVFQIHQESNVFDEIYATAVVRGCDPESDPTELPVDSLLFHDESERCRVDQTGNF
jgi:hypothetical protein